MNAIEEIIDVGEQLWENVMNLISSIVKENSEERLMMHSCGKEGTELLEI